MVHRSSSARKHAAFAAGLCGLALASCTHQSAPERAPIVAGAKYVAMGSSFAAGPGVTTSAESPPNRCQRSVDNYARQLARKRNLDLIDVSCSGATTAHILGAWNELPAQVEAIGPDTALVTITIGGNDVGFIGGLMVGSCEADTAQRSAGVATMCEQLRAYWSSTQQSAAAMPMAPDDAAWRELETGLDNIAAEVRRRAPQAQLVFVDYVTILPEDGLCAVLPLSETAAATARATSARLSQLTAKVALQTGADLIKASELSRDHHICAQESWTTGFVPPEGEVFQSIYHPKLETMTAIAGALETQLGQ